MKTQTPIFPRPQRGFTLVEMLVVMAVIVVLAAMIFPAASVIKGKSTIRKARSELLAVALAIENYKQKFGHYPPDHIVIVGGRMEASRSNSLYFELCGVVQKTATDFETLDGSARVSIADAQTHFGHGGFVNCAKGGGDDNAQAASVFLRKLPPKQYADLGAVPPTLRVLTCTIDWPEKLGSLLNIPNLPGANPWRYDCSSTNRFNSDGFDLWIDIVVGGKTNRISNWSETPTLVP